ncbi:MAG: hypothetical protein B6U69_01885 [Thermofilum sp. ex4484_15]|nr:MAG: hypothetical protein B6U69_01885 [Thermofilum sp. ex4484_15]
MSREALLKRKRRWILLHLLVLMLIIPVIMGLAYMLAEGIDTERVSTVYLPLAILVAAYAGLGLWKGYRMEIPNYRLVEIVKCTNCGYENVTTPKVGDYINMEKEPCPKCGRPMKVFLIYRERVRSSKKGG